jgi:hypothetical protein
VQGILEQSTIKLAAVATYIMKVSARSSLAAGGATIIDSCRPAVGADRLPR